MLPRSAIPTACLVATLVTPLAMTGCDRGAPAGNGSRTPLPEPVRAPVATTPGPALISFESTVHDFGRMSELEVRTAEYWFANAGGSPLEIREVRTSCGCTKAVTDKRTYAPGEWGRLTAEFDPSAPGQQTKHINLITNTRAGISRLQVKATVEAFLVIDPAMLKVGTLEYGKEQRLQITVHSPAPDLRIDRVGTTNRRMQASVLAERPRAGGYAVEVLLPADMPWGPFFSWLEVTGTGTPADQAAAVTHTSKIRVQGQLFGRLKAEPDTFRAGVQIGQAFSRTVTLSRTDRGPLRIVDYRLTTDNLTDAEVSITQAGASSYTIELTAKGGVRNNAVFSGRLDLVTDVPGEERISIAISGRVGDSGQGVG